MKKLFVLMLCGSILFACSNNKSAQREAASQETEKVSEIEIAEQKAVCIWDNVAVRDEPNAKGKWLTSVSLGEKLTYLGVSAVDSTDKNRNYFQVRLADGTEGWSTSDFIIAEAEAAAFLNDAEVYKRPDLLTKTDKAFSQMDIVAIKSTQDDWIEIVGKRSEGKWIDKGWVKSASITKADLDIAVAKFAKQALAQEEMDAKRAAIQEILDNADFSGSAFTELLKSEFEVLMEPKSSDEIEELENVDEINSEVDSLNI